MKVVLECVHKVDLGKGCDDCAAELSDRTLGAGDDRIIDPVRLLEALDDLTVLHVDVVTVEPLPYDEEPS